MSFRQTLASETFYRALPLKGEVFPYLDLYIIRPHRAPAFEPQPWKGHFSFVFSLLFDFSVLFIACSTGENLFVHILFDIKI